MKPFKDVLGLLIVRNLGANESISITRSHPLCLKQHYVQRGSQVWTTFNLGRPFPISNVTHPFWKNDTVHWQGLQPQNLHKYWKNPVFSGSEMFCLIWTEHYRHYINTSLECARYCQSMTVHMPEFCYRIKNNWHVK